MTKTYIKYTIKLLFESIKHFTCLSTSRVDLECSPVEWVLSPNIIRVLWNYVSIRCALRNVWGKREVHAQVWEKNSENKLFVRQQQKIYSTEFRINEKNFIFRIQAVTAKVYCVLPFYGTTQSDIIKNQHFGGIYWNNFKADINQTIQCQNPEDQNMNFCSALQGFQMGTTVRSSGHSNGTACLRMQVE
jgi:hypothetical protein